MKLLTTTELAKKLGVSAPCIRQWKLEERITPIAYDKRGAPLYLSTQGKPAARHKYPAK
jgi:hypothetical protein